MNYSLLLYIVILLMYNFCVSFIFQRMINAEKTQKKGFPQKNPGQTQSVV